MSAAQDRVRDTFGRYLDRTIQHSGACPDCDADMRMTEPSPGVFVQQILHDPTCPTYRAMEAAR